ncbi:synaptobrevin-like protein YKT6 [Nematocida minor]|uniref:synaptobrevin-like protein YKT6 n=1 Tax=Nematocida minor TaxID=1912983 RepID=UPI00221EAA09|nr:synaptobrevin-like protein YKT6 [Nematocida minor]KAI5192267.1 synaptobrevin-like protein YKT6 [Nematocida minor]
MSTKKASLFSIIIFSREKEDVQMYLEEYSLQSFSFFKRTPVQEMIRFISNRIVQNIETERSQEFIHKVEEGDSYKFFVREKRGYVYVITSLLEYPIPTLCLLIDDIVKYIQDNKLKCPELSHEIFNEGKEEKERGKEEKQKLKAFVKQQIKDYQNYEEKDVMLQIQNELDDVHDLLSKTVESAIGRGQKLHDLINSAEQLSFQTKSLYKLSKKQNQKCCGIM